MRSYKVVITLESPTVLGSGEGWGSLIDTDVVFDDIGLPYFPSKRFKGLLRHSAVNVIDMFRQSGLNFLNDVDVIYRAFGRAGDNESGVVIFNNLYLPDYEIGRQWLKYLLESRRLSRIISKDTIIDSMTIIRQHTSIDNEGLAENGSLRTIRALKRGLRFEGYLDFIYPDDDVLKLLALSCINLRHVGLMRHKGYGEVDCRLLDGDTDLSQKVVDELEARF
ncbi:CRISPR/Cas system CSM-associated protein Csm3, group 7 of RAMP superfamily [Caldanaerobius fijiensis DSM 17918]|uniref:CRISPR/Cas system CSM-associated protein Csm3, group 7 of RAMP superfamily n=1 Tax=Caldanaerobius fijiensis DSM 17918 TaxID=1121256 RepID=A0A1M5BRZ7_9THEO|nr:RAMP superfamily CRISPR-associated protein [Caldanaerobius fijiensis]SHF45012.1 CRISPR/Cas system CSM-associated protein Csm3, group 7 of RAMP superfamily [Caldanaerobius fijiensis DSM 17918]